MIYDYKSDELTQEVYIECICPIVDDIIDEYSTLRRYENLSIYAPSYIAREILGRLLDEIEVLMLNYNRVLQFSYLRSILFDVKFLCDISTRMVQHCRYVL